MTASEAGGLSGQSATSEPHLVAVLRMLLAEQHAGKPFHSLPKLCKRLNMRMSTLQRTLTQLEGADIVRFQPNASGATTVGLTEAGEMLAEALVPLLCQPSGRSP